MSLGTAVAVAQWAPSYRRATWLQAPLAVLSFVTGTSAWVLGGGIFWTIGALLIGLVVPFTFVGIMPTNHKLLAPGRDLRSAETRALQARGCQADISTLVDPERFSCEHPLLAYGESKPDWMHQDWKGLQYRALGRVWRPAIPSRP
jgi:hypothetical protein